LLNPNAAKTLNLKADWGKRRRSIFLKIKMKDDVSVKPKNLYETSRNELLFLSCCRSAPAREPLHFSLHY
jgi:hypothetical protein